MSSFEVLFYDALLKFVDNPQVKECRDVLRYSCTREFGNRYGSNFNMNKLMFKYLGYL